MYFSSAHFCITICFYLFICMLRKWCVYANMTEWICICESSSSTIPILLCIFFFWNIFSRLPGYSNFFSRQKHPSRLIRPACHQLQITFFVPSAQLLNLMTTVARFLVSRALRTFILHLFVRFHVHATRSCYYYGTCYDLVLFAFFDCRLFSFSVASLEILAILSE